MTRLAIILALLGACAPHGGQLVPPASTEPPDVDKEYSCFAGTLINGDDYLICTDKDAICAVVRDKVEPFDEVDAISECRRAGIVVRLAGD